MNPLLIFHHQVCEPPAYLCTYLEHRGVPFEIICMHEKQTVPDELDGIGGLVFMGGQGSVNDDKEWITRELALIKQADRRNMPILGVCFGAQLISKALGGIVYPGEEMEVGWHRIEAVNASKTATKPVSKDTLETAVLSEHSWLTALPETFEAFQWHAHTFTLPPGALPLWRSDCFQQQGFVRGKVLAMQFHMEVTADSIVELSRQYADDLSYPSDCVQSVAQLTAMLEKRTSQLHKMADLIYDCWLTQCGFI